VKGVILNEIQEPISISTCAPVKTSSRTKTYAKTSTRTKTYASS